MKKFFYILLLIAVTIEGFSQQKSRETIDFNKSWKFSFENNEKAITNQFNDAHWRVLNLPHDWSIEGQFSAEHLSTTQGGALPTGLAWYRKSFLMPSTAQHKIVWIEFDGVYRNSEIWINGHYLGKRPNGYASFRYELTKYLKFGKEKNVIAVKVDNSEQPNSRWYTGSGIYRNVRMIMTAPTAIDQWGVFATTPKVNAEEAEVSIEVNLLNKTNKTQSVSITSNLVDADGKTIASETSKNISIKDSTGKHFQQLKIIKPKLWSISNPYLYKIVTKVYQNNQEIDVHEIPLGMRFFNFDSAKGFSLNGEPTKIQGVCMHHDLGALGAAVNVRAIERQLELLKAMGCNGIRTAHNPPAPEFLDLCDKMGFIVMDEAFDMWKKRKSKKDYSADWNAWHQKDLEDFIKRDRNHPAIFMWSIGNEIREQFDSTGVTITRELAGIVKKLDNTRIVTSALTENEPAKNFIFQSGALDLLGFNYKHEGYTDFLKNFPNQKFIASETASALESRGRYEMPQEKIEFSSRDVKTQPRNADWTVSAYDNVAAYWGTTHEEAWKAVKNAPFIAGTYVWTGFDYLGEPHPYPWPARSAYFGIIDLAGFPKDVYYMYQSEWTDKPVLHLLPHWNWEKGKTIDVWAYYSQAEEVELFLNDKSLGIKRKGADEFHVKWSVNYEAGILKVVSRRAGKIILTHEIKTAGKAFKIKATADHQLIKADGKDLSFVKISIVDENGNPVPEANHLVNFSIEGEGAIVGVDNGYQASLEPFKANYRRAFNGLCLAIVQASETVGKIVLKASAEGLQSDTIIIETKK
ncbi:MULTISPECIES: beta-galactosidase GalB [unclassified Arcicella]|uniref:beta-galactosidase GalB n=1 Tax=unclassified Arcicella TaxID=2644986 RepID=UPI002859133F|nr:MULTISPECIES: beta-galactosidase GalB [unclassified Arcicella]MDR6561967.1 beta-galactosidase [Arcicella sp. BE51]MDR6811838.1 beta-galactosidase [Arcicella sp. BE140]MDR6822868.1 beta-galactosidase [Arcicella sp. BE139]